jgi:hypothetical protein
MNWRRGLFRLWAALSGLWMVLWLVIGIGAGDALVLGIAAGDVFSGRLAYMITFLAVLFAPPVVLGIILLLAMWVAGAFTRPE